MKKIVDTNIWLEAPGLIEKGKYVVPTGVLRELDGLKNNINPETAEKARRAAIYISRNLANVEFLNTDDCRAYKNLTVDDTIIKAAQKNKYTIVSNDVALKLKAISKGVEVEGYSVKEDYSGVSYYPIKTDDNRYNKELDDALSTGVLPRSLSLCENQYVVFQDATHGNEVMAIFKCKGGELVQVNDTTIKNQYINYIRPRNVEQTCLFDALRDTSLSIVLTDSPYGCGKSYCMNNYALSQLEKGKIQKIVYVPNNATVAGSMEFGFIPGSLSDKLTPFLGGLADLIGIDEINNLMTTEQLEVVPIAFMRGRSFANSIIIVNEAQNLSEDHVKLLIGRVGENSRIFFDSDFSQADASLFKNKSGVKLLTKLRKSPQFSKMFACVKLLTTERSETAKAAAYLNDI